MLIAESQDVTILFLLAKSRALKSIGVKREVMQ